MQSTSSLERTRLTAISGRNGGALVGRTAAVIDEARVVEYVYCITTAPLELDSTSGIRYKILQIERIDKKCLVIAHWISLLASNSIDRHC